ncbi:MAG: hypothetical protein QGG40_03730, partial [Myxococcota bacterium]|nr:hypothetical protein [Myxococcota bacterium]
MTALRTLAALLLVACQHRPVGPATAPVAEPVVPAATSHSATPSGNVLKGFVYIEGSCHWAHLDAVTGDILQASPIPSQTCPYRAIVTTSPRGTTLMAVHFPEHNELWRQQGTTADVVEIPGHPYLEMAWVESGRVHATTFNFRMDHVFDFPDLDALPTEPTEEEPEDPWHHDCYTYALTEGDTESEPNWELVREETVELSEGSMRPHCPVGDVAWVSTWNDYAQYSFESLEDSHSYADPGKGMSWG